MRTEQTSVLIVGGGPVGLSLAMDLGLARHRRHRRRNPLSWRTAEREMQPRLRAHHGDLSPTRPFTEGARHRPAGRLSERRRLTHDVYGHRDWRASRSPPRNERYTATGGPDTWWPTSEPPHRINQTFLEPVMFAHAKAMPGVRILNRTEVTDFTQSESGIVATLRDLDSNETFQVTAKYLAGCDGSRSHDPPPDRSEAFRHPGDPARAIDLHPRAAIAGYAARQACLDVSVAQSAPLRHRDCNRRPRDLAHPQSPL